MVWGFMRKGSGPSGIHPTHPRKRREDGWGTPREEMIGFWGMTHYPEQRVELDLGGRTIWIWGNPGHVESEFAYYDRYTKILFTGDMFYRGRCYISFWDRWFASMERLVAFVDKYPVTHVVGCHVEISRTGEGYPYGITYQPGIYFTGAVFLCNQTRGEDDRG